MDPWILCVFPFLRTNSEDLSEANAMPGIVMSHRKTEPATSGPGPGGFLGRIPKVEYEIIDPQVLVIGPTNPLFCHVSNPARKEGLLKAFFFGDEG